MIWAQNTVFMASLTVSITGALFLLLFWKWRTEQYLLYFGISNIVLGVGYYLAFSMVSGNTIVPPAIVAAILFSSALCLVTGTNLFAGDKPHKFTVPLLVLFAAALIWILLTGSSAARPVAGPMAISLLVAVYQLAKTGPIYALCALPLLMRAIVLIFGAIQAEMDPQQIPPVSNMIFVLQAIMLVFATAIRQLEHNETERKRLRREARTDGLTGILNRRYFFRDIDHHLSTFQPQKSALILMDIDNFRTINQNHGHPVGDEVIQKLISEFRQALRPGDIFGRVGGEEFAVYLPDASVQDAAQIAERLRDRTKVVSVGDCTRVTVSFGVAELPKPPLKNDQALHWAADAALVEAKKNGKDCVYVFEDSAPVRWQPSPVT